MGGLVSGLYGLFAGDPTKPEEDQLNSLSGYETGVGEGDTTAASKYYQDILSGDPSRISQSLAPEISSGQVQGQQKKNELAQFGTRSGGSTAATEGIDAANRGNIINLVGGLQSGAASGAASLGSTSLGQAASATTADAGLKEHRRNDVMSDIGGVANGAAQIAAEAFGAGGGEGGDPYQSLYQAQHTGSPVSTVNSDESGLFTSSDPVDTLSSDTSDQWIS